MGKSRTNHVSIEFTDDEGIPAPQRRTINFVGPSVTVTDNPATGNTDITIVAGTAGHVIQEEGTPLTQRAALNFVGASVTATDNPGNNSTDVTIIAAASGGRAFSFFIS